MTVRLVAHEALPALLVLYPLLLLLDDLEPGFVRSVVNPHWFLLMIIVVGMIAGREMASPSPTSLKLRGTSRFPLPPPLAPPLREGEKWKIVFAFVAAMVAGFWVWWRVGGGRIGVVVGFLTAVAIAGIVIEMGRARNVKVQSSRS